MRKVAYQGHRGCRGLMPENTIPAFKKALEYVNILELDVVVSKDHKIIVSHEPWMSSVICSSPNGDFVKKEEAKNLNLYQLNYDEIKAYDCGLRGHPKFPEQEKIKAHKPSLKEMVMEIEKYCNLNSIPKPWYDIEIKSSIDLYDYMVPQPEVFVELILKELEELGLKERCNLQSFDLNILEQIKKQDESIVIAYLVELLSDVEKNLKKLSFKPDIYSPDFRFVTQRTIRVCHDKGIKVIPWTVNKKKDMKKLTELGVDGIITDYPNLALE